VLPAGSVARTWKVWLPRPGRYSSSGSCRLRGTPVELAGEAAAASLAVKLKLALLLMLTASGPDVMVVSGGVYPLSRYGWPASGRCCRPDRWRVLGKCWLPSARRYSSAGSCRLRRHSWSSRQAKLLPAFVAVKLSSRWWNAAAGGAAVMAVSGAVASTVQV